MLTFANIGKIIGSASPAEMPIVEGTRVEPTDAVEDDAPPAQTSRPKL